MRKPLLVSGALGGVVVLAVALLAVATLKSPSSSATNAAGLTSAAGASPSGSAAVVGSPAAKHSASAKPTTSSVSLENVSLIDSLSSTRNTASSP